MDARASMDVFLVPVGARYEVYTEEPAGEAEPPPAPEPTAGVARGLWARLRRFVAETIAEQRLLGRLRRHSVCGLVHPDDISPDQARAFLRAALQRDRDKHRRWLVIDGLLLVVSVPLTLIPGPNVAALYFSARVVGHYLSLRGAARGLTAIAFTPRASAPLRAVRDALTLRGDRRTARLDELTAALGLRRLSGFLARVAPPA